MPKRPRLTAALRRQIIEREGRRCAYCRSPMIVGVPMVVDHVIPLTAGGTSTLDNLPGLLPLQRIQGFSDGGNGPQ